MTDPRLLQGTTEVAYPFVLEDVELPPNDPEANEWRKVKSWRPGVRHEADNDSTYAVADGMGTLILTFVSRHKPGRYPARVFFTREWVTPDGNRFGTTKLHVAVESKFRRLCNGYPYHFEMASDLPKQIQRPSRQSPSLVDIVSRKS